MYFLLLFSILCVSIQNSSAVINRINRTEHARMPPVFSLDVYEACLLRNNATGEYCTVKFDLLTDEPSDLYNLITEYSARRETHFNHTKLMHGICLTKTCNHLCKQNTTADRRHVLEACLNDTFWKEYRLKTRVTEHTCHTLEDKRDLDSYDYMVAAFISILLVLSIVGTLQDCCFGSECNEKGYAFLSCFSVVRNWRKLVSPAGEGPDPRLRRLVGFNGIKVICIIYLVSGHGMMALAIDSENTYFAEQVVYQSTFFRMFVTCALLMVQWCFMVSSFLLFYNMEIYTETHKITWNMLPKALLIRWLRFTPAYAVVLALNATWLRHFDNGPLWEELVMTEVNHCRREWWINLLYISNYVDRDRCLIHSWYIAADFQLFFLGMAVYVFTAGRRRKLILALLFIVGMLLPAAHTFIQDLDGMLLFTPETVQHVFENDRLFYHVYKRTHTNLPCYIAGLSLGLLVYHLQKTGYQIPKTGSLRFLYWLTLPIALTISHFGGLFYDGDASLYSRTLYAGLVKPLWAVNGAFFIFGMVNQFEDLYRGVVEWPGWTAPSRLSYSLFLIHITLLRVINGTRTTTMNFSVFQVLEMMSSTVVLSFMAAVPFHLLVEAPFNQLVKLWMSPSNKQHKNHEKSIKDDKNEGIIDTKDDGKREDAKNEEILNGKQENCNNDVDSGMRRRMLDKNEKK